MAEERAGKVAQACGPGEGLLPKYVREQEGCRGGGLHSTLVPKILRCLCVSEDVIKMWSLVPKKVLHGMAEKIRQRESVCDEEKLLQVWMPSLQKMIAG